MPRSIPATPTRVEGRGGGNGRATSLYPRPPGVVFRPTGIYGPGTSGSSSCSATSSRGAWMIGRGDAYYHLTYIDDLTDGIVLCGTHPRAPGNVYILGGARYAPLRELVETIAEAPGFRSPACASRSPSSTRRRSSREKVCRPLGIEPPIFRRRVDFFRKATAHSTSPRRSGSSATRRVWGCRGDPTHRGLVPGAGAALTPAHYRRGHVKKICVLGNFSGRNAGDAAILGSPRGCPSRHPDTLFAVPTINPGFVRRAHARYRVKPVGCCS